MHTKLSHTLTTLLSQTHIYTHLTLSTMLMTNTNTFSLLGLKSAHAHSLSHTHSLSHACSHTLSNANTHWLSQPHAHSLIYIKRSSQFKNLMRGFQLEKDKDLSWMKEGWWETDEGGECCELKTATFQPTREVKERRNEIKRKSWTLNEHCSDLSACRNFCRKVKYCRTCAASAQW